MPGCCAVGSAPALGAGGREFESRHSDHKKSHDKPFINAVLSWLYLLLLRVHFARMSLIFALFWAYTAVKGAWGVPQQVTETALLYIRKHCLLVPKRTACQCNAPRRAAKKGAQVKSHAPNKKLTCSASRRNQLQRQRLQRCSRRPSRCCGRGQSTARSAPDQHSSGGCENHHRSKSCCRESGCQ